MVRYSICSYIQLFVRLLRQASEAAVTKFVFPEINRNNISHFTWYFYHLTKLEIFLRVLT